MDLVEIEAIKRLKYKYLRCLDQKLWDELAECFVENATSAYGGGKYSYEGRDAIIEWLKKGMDRDGFHSTHSVHQPEIELVADDRATGVWKIEDIVVEESGESVFSTGLYETDGIIVYVRPGVAVAGKRVLLPGGESFLSEEIVDETEARISGEHNVSAVLVVIGGDGQVTLGDTVMKGNARKVRQLYKGKVIAGFAGGTADAFTLFERFEGQLEKHSGNLTRAAVELAKDWRTASTVVA